MTDLDPGHVPADLLWLLDMGLEVRLIPADDGLEVALADDEGNPVGEVRTAYGEGIPAALKAARELAEEEGLGA